MSLPRWETQCGQDQGRPGKWWLLACPLCFFLLPRGEAAAEDPEAGMSAVWEPLFSLKERLGPLGGRLFSMAGKRPSSPRYLPFACLACPVPGILSLLTLTLSFHGLLSVPAALFLTWMRRSQQSPLAAPLGQRAAFLKEAVALSPALWVWEGLRV